MPNLAIEFSNEQKNLILRYVAATMGVISDDLGLSKFETVAGSIWALGVIAFDAGLGDLGLEIPLLHGYQEAARLEAD